MKKTLRNMLSTAVAVSLLMCTGGLALAAKEGKPLTPELAAKKENHRKQNEQRVTHTQRETAAQSLKDQRKKVLKAKRDAKQSKESNPNPIQ